VFRIPSALASYRSDLLQLTVATEPTGTLLIAKLDPTNRVLAQHADDIVREYVMPDPQPVPAAVLARDGALDPQETISLELWDELKAARPAL
jgi:hypothetical protein